MKDKMLRLVEDYRVNFCPYGSLDIKRAIEVALEVGEDVDWAVECVTELAESISAPVGDLDPVYAVYYAVHQEARTDIEDITDKDIFNDCEGHCDVYGNYLCTSFDYDDKFRDWLIGILKGTDVDEFTEFTRFFLDELNIDSEDLKIKENEDN